MSKSEIESRYDVVIIGSGPAGAATAKSLTGHGLKTVIVEKAKLPDTRCAAACCLRLP